jgi:hypothetical protein
VDTRRFLAAVPRGIGDTTQKKLEVVARKKGVSLLVAMNDPEALAEADIPERAQKKCLAVSESVLNLGARIRRQTREAQAGLFDSTAPVGAKDAIALAVEVSGVADRLHAEGSIEAEGRLENLNELLSAAAEWAEQARAQGEPDDVVGFLESASLLSSTDEAKDGRGQVTLMSLHAAKGLEFDVVYLAGLEEHGFPHARALAEGTSGDALEEERRLAYVGITRARRRLVLSYADFRMVQGQRKRRTPSRFLHEIPREVLDGDLPPRSFDRLDLWRQRAMGEGAPQGPRLPGASHVVYDEDGYLRRARLVMTDADFVPDELPRIPDVHVPDSEPTASFVPEEGAERGRPAPRLWRATGDGGDAPVVAAPTSDGDAPPLDAGARVWHRLFGSGTVVGLRGSGRSAAALVRFDEERQPRVIVARHLRAENDGDSSG